MRKLHNEKKALRKLTMELNVVVAGDINIDCYYWKREPILISEPHDIMMNKQIYKGLNTCYEPGGSIVVSQLLKASLKNLNLKKTSLKNLNINKEDILKSDSSVVINTYCPVLPSGKDLKEKYYELPIQI